MKTSHTTQWAVAEFDHAGIHPRRMTEAAGRHAVLKRRLVAESEVCKVARHGCVARYAWPKAAGHNFAPHSSKSSIRPYTPQDRTSLQLGICSASTLHIPSFTVQRCARKLCCALLPICGQSCWRFVLLPDTSALWSCIGHDARVCHGNHCRV